MDISMWTGIVALSVGALGALAYSWRFRSNGTVPLTAVWLTAPLLGAVIAFLLGPPNLVMLGLAGLALVMAVLAVIAPLVAAAIRGRPDGAPSKTERGALDRAA